MKANGQERTWAKIDLQALKSNLQRVRQITSATEITAVIKANGYGHGMDEIARTLAEQGQAVDCFAVATMDEVVALNMSGTGKRIMLLQGYRDAAELKYLIEAGVEFVIHADYQLAILKSVLRDMVKPAKKLTLWLKLDTGMNRLGLDAADFSQACAFLQGSSQIGRIIGMSHLACADDPENEQALARTEGQLSRFSTAMNAAGLIDNDRASLSLAASAGILAWPKTHFNCVRPGIMLYGGSPFANKLGPQLGLQPVMTLCSRLIAIKQVPAGGVIGYGGTYTCEQDTAIGVVSIGYGDGYPRSAPTGTPVLVKTAEGYHRTRLLGRVSMDMITIDLTGLTEVGVGDEVVLWGEGLPADEVARFANTISYELFCQVTRRVHFIYS